MTATRIYPADLWHDRDRAPVIDVGAAAWCRVDEAPTSRGTRVVRISAGFTEHEHDERTNT